MRAGVATVWEGVRLAWADQGPAAETVAGVAAAEEEDDNDEDMHQPTKKK